MQRKIRILICGMIWAGGMVAPVEASLESRIDDILSAHQKIRFSIHIVKASTGTTVYAHREKECLIPASNMKIVTSAAALQMLGPDFEYNTQVGLSGDTLVVVGSGDPLLGDRETDETMGRAEDWLFDEIAQKMTQAGIKEINDIVMDSTVFDDERVHPSWPAAELNRDYACEVSGINYNDNCISMHVANTGNHVTVDWSPETTFVTIKNRVKPIHSGTGAVGAYRIPGHPNALIVRGSCRREQGPINVAIEKPAVFLGYLLSEQLNRRDIAVTGRLIETVFVPDDNYQPLITFRTPLIQCLKRCNKDSFNLAAECLAKTLAAQQNGGRNGSWQGAREVISTYLTHLGIKPSEFVLDDASGLSRHNRLSARVLTTVLLSVYRSPHWALYKQTLAVAGVDGTIDNDFNVPAYQGKIFAKTGYINNVRAFSGLCETSKGDYLFSILANDANNIKSLVNGIVTAIIDEM